MASFLKGLRGNGKHSELRKLADRLTGQKETLEQLITKAEGSSRQLGKLTEPIPKLNERLAALERQVTIIEGRVSGVAAVQHQTAGLFDAHRHLKSQLADSRSEAERITAQLDELRGLVEVATGLKRDLGEFCQFEAPLRVVKDQGDALKTGMAELEDGYRRLRESRDELAQKATDATSRLAAIEQASQAAARDVENCGRRVAELEQTIGSLPQVAASASDVKHQLLTVKSLADHVMQKVAALENQRHAVERAAKDVSQLDALVHQVDAAIREQANQIARVRTLASDAEGLESKYRAVAILSKEVGGLQRQIEERERATRQTLAALDEQLGKANELVELEHRGLETVSQRIGGLKTDVAECEERMRRLEASSRTVTEVEAQADKLWTRLGFFKGELDKLNELPERIRIIGRDTTRLHELMQQMSAQGVELEKAKPAVEAALRDIAGLSRTHEAIKEALEQMRVAQEEMERAQSSRASTDAWLKTVQESVADLQERVRQLDVARPTVESMQRDVQRVVEATELVASRRQFMDDVGTRLTELGSLAAQLDDHTKAFRSRLEIAEGRFVSVTKQAEETERIANAVSALSSTVTQADGRVADLTRSITSLESRSQHLEETAERARLLGMELEQRQNDLERASEHLARAVALRREAAGAVEMLDERILSLQSALGAVESRTKRLEIVSAELDSYCGRIRTVEGGMAEFEKQLGTFESAKLDIRRALDQLANRQTTVTGLQASINQMFEVADRTANDLKAAAEAHREIRESRASLDDLLSRLHDADAVAAGIEVRRQEIEQAEQRLARAQALLIDIQSSLEMLNNQKALLDQVIEQAGSLAFQIQQAEGLVERLRRERDTTNAVRSALEDGRARASRPRQDG
jgi:DNA repair exonuclease SbcCD ATPase subunit